MAIVSVVKEFGVTGGVPGLSRMSDYPRSRRAYMQIANPVKQETDRPSASGPWSIWVERWKRSLPPSHQGKGIVCIEHGGVVGSVDGDQSRRNDMLYQTKISFEFVVWVLSKFRMTCISERYTVANRLEGLVDRWPITAL